MANPAPSLSFLEAASARANDGRSFEDVAPATTEMVS